MPAEIGEEIALEGDRLVAEDLLGSRDEGRLGLIGGGSCSPSAATTVSGAIFSALRSTLPEVRRGSDSATSKWPGTM